MVFGQAGEISFRSTVTRGIVILSQRHQIPELTVKIKPSLNWCVGVKMIFHLYRGSELYSHQVAIENASALKEINYEL